MYGLNHRITKPTVQVSYIRFHAEQSSFSSFITSQLAKNVQSCR